MALQWFGKTRSPGVGQLVARRKFAKAIELLRRDLERGASNPRLRMQLADVLAMADRGAEAVPVLIDLADDYANEGAGAKAIAVLKKLQRLAPGRGDVERRLTQLIRKKDRGPRATTGRVRAVQPGPGGFSGPVYATSVTATPVVTDSQRIAAARGATWSPTTRPEDAPPAEDVGTAPPPLATPDPRLESEAALPADDEVIEVSEEEFRGQVLDTISAVLRAPTPAAPEPEPEAELEIEPDPIGEVAESPLFSSFSEDELLALIDGLRLLSFEPGDVIVAEGDPGDSLFVLTTGLVKAFIRRPEGGAPRLVRRLAEGEFFGEISILSGKQRTATVTAATHCELLELDRATLDRITESHPNVHRILEDFYIQRAST